MTLRRWYGFLRMQMRVARQVPRHITVSENSKKDIAAQMGVDLDTLHVVPVGVDQQQFRPLAHVARVPGRLMTTASADVPLKGLTYLIEALAKVRTEREDAHLVVIGRPRHKSAVPAQLARLGLTDAVEFVSGVTDERIVELYAEAEIAVVPSLYEGFSLPAIEAMACGVPLVTTTGGALPEVVGPSGDTAMTVPTGDAGALAHQIVETLNSPEQRARLGEGGRRRVLDRFTWRKTAEGSAEQYYLELEAHARRRFDAGERA
jgi:glycosyltransferase involved in cell wall biosynthesis